LDIGHKVLKEQADQVVGSNPHIMRIQYKRCNNFFFDQQNNCFKLFSVPHFYAIEQYKLTHSLSFPSEVFALKMIALFTR
jgi:hypothetical protein